MDNHTLLPSISPDYDRSLMDGTWFPLPDAGRTLEQHDPSADKLCVICEKQGSLRCSRCNAPYCSSKCQTEDWPIHKAICRDMAGRCAPSQRPSHGDRLMLLFPMTKPQPELVWVNTGSEATMFHISDQLKPVLSQDINTNIVYAPDLLSSIVVNYSIPFRHCGHTLRLVCLDFSCQLGMVLGVRVYNRSTMRLSKPGHSKIQHGALMIYTELPDPLSTSLTTKVLDVTPRDLRSAVDFFQSMKLNPCISNPSRYPTGAYDCEMWPAIKINCDGDLMRFKTFLPEGQELPRFESVQVPSKAFESVRHPSRLAQMLGLPWMVSKPLTNIGHSLVSGENKSARWFTFVLDRKMAKFDPRWYDVYDPSCGTIIVNHATGAPLHPLHVEWLDAYMTDIRVTNRMPDVEFEAMATSLRAHIQKDEKLTDDELGRLTQHWNEFLKKKGHDPETSGIVSPWDV